jgi:peptidyl-prolyl cis-trans isomerase SurA
MKCLKVKFLVSLICLGMAVTLHAQINNETVLMTIGGKNVTVGEFMSIYLKNNPKPDTSVNKTNQKGEVINKQNLSEYLDLYINFKLKVREAEDLGLDTLTSFRTELNGYRDQLAKPYFSDEPTIDRLIEEAYDREHYDVRTSHIFIRLGPDVLPADTLVAYNKILAIRNRLEKGEAFEKLALEESEDASARDREANQQHPLIRGNHGDLGYFTVFDMVYPFENGAYNNEIGKVSPIVRTEYGYHLIKLTDKRSALGKVTVSHLFLMMKKDATKEDSVNLKLRIDSIYTKLQGGATWDDLVKQYSDDKGSAAKGGALPKFGVNRMVPEFIDAIYKMEKPGDYSAPVQTPYGWHIIRLTERKLPGSFADEKADLKQRVLKDVRHQLAVDVVYNKIKSESNFTDFPEAKADFYRVVTDSIFVGKWDVNQAKDLIKPMFKVGNITYKQPDFAQYLASKQKKSEKDKITSYVNKAYRDYVTESLTKWENGRLEQKYPEFKNLMTEYRDGILLFDLTDQKVWSKAIKDTVGLKQFFESNRKNYVWGNRVDASIFTLKDRKQSQKVRNFIKSGLTDDAVLKELNIDSHKILTVESGKYSRKDNKFVDMVPWNVGISNDIPSDSAVVIVNIHSLILPENKTLNEARGIITADYQNFLEKIWIQYLRQKYPVNLKKEVFSQIK